MRKTFFLIIIAIFLTFLLLGCNKESITSSTDNSYKYFTNEMELRDIGESIGHDVFGKDFDFDEFQNYSTGKKNRKLAEIETNLRKLQIDNISLSDGVIEYMLNSLNNWPDSGYMIAMMAYIKNSYKVSRYSLEDAEFKFASMKMKLIQEGSMKSG